MVSLSVLQTKRAHQDAEFLRLSVSIRRALWDLANQLFDRTITAEVFGERAAAILQEGHARAAMFGRIRGGVLGPLSAEDRWIADMVMQEQSRFLRRFVNDLASDKYIGADGEYIRAPINQRVQMYAARMRGTAYDTFVGASENEARFEWILIAEDNCDDCPRLAAGGPYTKLSIPTRPGEGKTQCIMNCKCVLLRDDGVLGPIYPYTEAGEAPL